ncbi:MAG: hypothetical protein LQ351_002814 [Letrouitia transgressa]|nr:MAG: hypothetical protein LQ351_002814 [Letrouitia transgressa]
MTDLEEWSTNANQALTISFVQSGQTSVQTLSTFHPRFTYPIFGEEERIFGYQGLQINLRFAAHDLLPNIQISYDKRFKPVGDTKATDLLEKLKEWTPQISFQKATAFDSSIQNDSSAPKFQPPGELVQSYTSQGRQFEIWRGELAEIAVQRLIERIQILISLFIEGGTPLPLDDQDWSLARWTVFFVYEKLSDLPSPNASPYSLVGYSTSYRFIIYHTLPPAQESAQDKAVTHDFELSTLKPVSPASLPARARISQFLILPSHQGHSHGTHLFNAMTSTFLNSPSCVEITVEDPNEAFDDLRDYCDYSRLLANGTLSQISLNNRIPSNLTSKRIGVKVPTSQLLDKPLLETLCKKNKLAPRQFDRLVEMHLLSKLPLHTRQSGTARITQRGRSTNENDRAWYYWRLLVKQRIYKKNRDVLAQLDRIERIEKVEEQVGELAGDYERLLRAIERRKSGDGNPVGDNNNERKERGKRKVVLEDEEEDGTPEPKKLKDDK